MLWLSRLTLRLRSLLRPGALDQQLNDELEFHLSEQKAEYMAQGLSEIEAEAAARRAFGARTAFEEKCRDERRTRWFEDLMQDIRYACRSLWHSPTFSLVAVLTLALGIGANAAFFSAAYGILFRPLPYPLPDRLVDMEDGIGGVGPVTSLRSLSRTTDYAGYLPNNDLNLQAGGEASKIDATAVTWNLAQVLIVSPARGRWFDQAEEELGRNRVAVLSDGAWRRRFGADQSILGKKITLNEQPFEVIGVMPPGFAFPTAAAEIWIPIGIDPRNVGYMWGGGNLWPIGRLRNGMTLAGAQAELTPAVNRIRTMFPWRMPDAWARGARPVLRSEALIKDVRPKLFALSVAALLLLLIACVNVANLLLARGLRREREFAMREALGAARSRLFRQIMTENLVLVAVGGTIGLFVATLILKALPSLLPPDTPRLDEVVLDPTLIVGAAVGMLLTVLLFSVTPMLGTERAHRDSMAGRSITSSKRASHISLGLIGFELALATALLVGAGLMGRTLWNLANVDAGLQSKGVLSARVSAGPSRCGDGQRCFAWLTGLSRTLAEVPGIRSVNWSNTAPMDKEISAVAVDLQDHPKAPGAPAFVFWETSATPGYFRALGIPLLAGRLFADSDNRSAQGVIIVSQATAKHFWPNESALGKQIRPMSEQHWRTVIGVVGDVAHYSLTGFPSWIDGVQYRPLTQTLPPVAKGVQLTMFVESSQTQIAASVQAVIRQRFPDVVVSRIQALERIRSESVSEQRSTALLLTLFAGVGLLLGSAGVYGLISNRAEQRTHEIGIRMALGASAGRVVAMLLQETVVVSAAGALVGVVAAYGLSRFLRSLLFGVSADDMLTLSVCPLVLLTAAILASAIPGFRATRTDPALTLRQD